MFALLLVDGTASTYKSRIRMVSQLPGCKISHQFVCLEGANFSGFQFCERGVSTNGLFIGCCQLTLLKK